MGIWDSGGADIDYTLLQKKGLIKKKIEKESPFKINSKGELDLTQSMTEFKPLTEQTLSNTSNKQDQESPFAFLDNISRSSEVVSNPFSGTEMQKTSEDNKEVNAMKIKVEDLEYKLERLIEKLTLIESKIDGFEKRVF